MKWQVMLVLLLSPEYPTQLVAPGLLATVGKLIHTLPHQHHPPPLTSPLVRSKGMRRAPSGAHEKAIELSSRPAYMRVFAEGGNEYQWMSGQGMRIPILSIVLAHSVGLWPLITGRRFSPSI